MRRYFYLTFMLIFFSVAQAGSLTFTEVAKLPEILNETSGLTYYQHQLWTLADSGHQKIFALSLKGEIQKTLAFNAKRRHDWEAIAHNQRSFFIGDFGNNRGNRRNLSIYILPLKKLNHRSRQYVRSRVIRFKYPDQTSFHKRPYKHNFDAEALLAFKSKLWVFTKNWGNQKSSVYELPVKPGRYRAKKIATLQVNLLVTDAAYYHNQVWLLGYNPLLFSLKPIVLQYDYYPKQHQFIFRKKYNVNFSGQAEGLVITPGGTMYISKEKGRGDRAVLYRALNQVDAQRDGSQPL